MTLRRFLKPLLLAAALLGFGSAVWAAPVQAVLFTSPYCPHCRHLKQDGFPQQLREKYPEVELFEYDLTEQANNVLFFQTLQAYQLESAGIPMLVVGETILQGYPTQIGSGADEAIKKAISNREKTRVPGLPAAKTEKAPAPKTAPAKQAPAKTEAQQPEEPADRQVAGEQVNNAAEEAPAASSSALRVTSLGGFPGCVQPESSMYFISSANCLGARASRSNWKRRFRSLLMASVSRTRASVRGLYTRFSSSFTWMASLSNSDLMTGNKCLMPLAFSNCVTHCSGSALSKSNTRCSFSGNGSAASKSGLYTTSVSLSNFIPEGMAALYTSPSVHR